MQTSLKKNILNIKRGDLQITPLFWFVDRVPKKSSAIFGCNKTHALKTHRWGHKKSPGRFGGSEGVVPHCNLVGCGSLRWLESVSESRTSQKVVRHWKKRMNPFFASCSCYFFLFMLFHLKNWADDIEAREWSIATAIESLTSNISGQTRGFPPLVVSGAYLVAPATPVVWAWTDSSPSWSITYHSSFAGGCVMPLLPGCQRGWKVGPGRPPPVSQC